MVTHFSLGYFASKRVPVSGSGLTDSGNFKTEIAQRLSVVLSLAAAYFIFQEQFNQLKILGIALGISAVLCILLSHRQSSGQGSQGMLYLGLVWMGYALIDVLLKYTTSLGLQFAVALNLMFVCAMILSMLYLLLKYHHLGWQGHRLRPATGRTELRQHRLLCQGTYAA